MDKVEIFYQLGRIREAFSSCCRIPENEAEAEQFFDALDRINLQLVKEVTKDMALDALCAIPSFFVQGKT